ncbi:MAG: orotidine-5'-phosphate decarboxylase [Rickettsiales bacterium]|nr:orotidine-5'-phosphate decarboxylase [Rickettsiales bacterium]
MNYNPIILALDSDNLENSWRIFNEVKQNIGMLKLGLEFVYNFGFEEVKKFQSEIDIFLDLKLHDIPNTTKSALKPIAKLNTALTTIHLLGGSEMVKESKKILQEHNSKTKLLGVTILTSHKDISEIGINNSITSQVLKLAEMGLKAGVDGLVCSPHEIEIIRKEFGFAPILVVPGIRLDNDTINHQLSTIICNDDQSRIATPKEAILSGANYLVIGRPITKSHTPKEECMKILKNISST